MFPPVVVRRFRRIVNRLHSRLEVGARESWFIDRGSDQKERQVRAGLIRGFHAIGRQVKAAHSEMEVLQMADFLLRSPLAGPMVECGCYKGAATAKLSLVARATGRLLYVCDSFAGLPSPTADDQELRTMHQQPYEQGMFTGTMAEVQENIARCGASDVCRFVRGYFDQTLPTLKVPGLSFVFMDVDLISSARTCLRHLWPQMASGGRFFTHEARDLPFLKACMESAWWQSELGQAAPLLIGAGQGCADGAPQLAFLDKV